MEMIFKVISEVREVVFKVISAEEVRDGTR